MSGDSQRSDDPDFLEDDFVIEDLAGKNDDLEQLFEDPRAGAAGKPKPGGPAAAPDSDDVLFTDHTAGVEPSESFQAKGGFAEDNKSDWTGDKLELDSDEPKAGKAAAAKAAFPEELGSLQGDEELPLDDKELELVDGPSAPADGISEIEQSGPFVLDDGERAWQEQVAQTPAVEPEVAQGIWEAVKDPAMAEHSTEEANAATAEPGWEALPESSVDQLSEVGEVERAGEADAVPDAEELAEVDGHDIYGDDQASVLVGPRAARARRASGWIVAMAASLAMVCGGAVVVLRPEWVGLQLEPQRVQQVQIERPRIELALAAPAAVQVPVPQLGKGDPPTGTSPVQVPDQPDPVAVVPTPNTELPEYGPLPLPEPQPVATAPTLPAVIGTPSNVPAVNWPAATHASPSTDPKGKGKGKTLVRVGDNTMLGDVDTTERAPRVQAVEGVLPGTRAFAQLHNGNYFIGSIKVAEADRVTLRLAQGEVTLGADEVMRLTALGSADYEALQKATSGFVRLTNSNKLVGAILSQIADDHIVLEFRSNRVILPKSAIGEVVQGEPEQDVRLEVTREEDDWVRSLAERQLGTGSAPSKEAPAPMKVTPLAPPTTTSETSPVPPPAVTPAPKAVAPKAAKPVAKPTPPAPAPTPPPPTKGSKRSKS